MVPSCGRRKRRVFDVAAAGRQDLVLAAGVLSASDSFRPTYGEIGVQNGRTSVTFIVGVGFLPHPVVRRVGAPQRVYELAQARGHRRQCAADLASTTCTCRPVRAS